MLTVFNSFSGFCQDGGLNLDVCYGRIEGRFSDEFSDLFGYFFFEDNK